MTDETREGWLGRAVLAMSDMVAEAHGKEMPPVRVSVGWPGGRANREATIGQCWATSATQDKVNQIFVTPVVGKNKTVDVLGTLLHEMIHAIDDCSSGHRGAFASTAKALGFVAPLTASGNRTRELNQILKDVAAEIGPFPHPAIKTKAIAADTPKKQSTRMIKMQCPEDGYSARTSRMWINDLGLPTCPCGTPMEEV